MQRRGRLERHVTHEEWTRVVSRAEAQLPEDQPLPVSQLQEAQMPNALDGEQPQGLGLIQLAELDDSLDSIVLNETPQQQRRQTTAATTAAAASASVLDRESVEEVVFCTKPKLTRDALMSHSQKFTKTSKPEVAIPRLEIDGFSRRTDLQTQLMSQQWDPVLCAQLRVVVDDLAHIAAVEKRCASVRPRKETISKLKALRISMESVLAGELASSAKLMKQAHATSDAPDLLPLQQRRSTDGAGAPSNAERPEDHASDPNPDSKFISTQVSFAADQKNDSSAADLLLDKTAFDLGKIDAQLQALVSRLHPSDEIGGTQETYQSYNMRSSATSPRADSMQSHAPSQTQSASQSSRGDAFSERMAALRSRAALVSARHELSAMESPTLAKDKHSKSSADVLSLGGRLGTITPPAPAVIVLPHASAGSRSKDATPAMLQSRKFRDRTSSSASVKDLLKGSPSSMGTIPGEATVPEDQTSSKTVSREDSGRSTPSHGNKYASWPPLLHK
eukprot:ANDGO_02637.mRNA.1 hypothetical protein